MQNVRLTELPVGSALYCLISRTDESDRSLVPVRSSTEQLVLKHHVFYLLSKLRKIWAIFVAHMVLFAAAAVDMRRNGIYIRM